jgi:anthranilate synthase component 1
VYYPGQSEFLKLAGQGNLIPVTRRILADLETPLSAYRKIRGQGESFLCESVEGGEHIGRYSFVGCNPRAVIKQTGPRVEIDRERQGRRELHRRPGVQAAGRRSRTDWPWSNKSWRAFKPVAMPGLPRFSGGALGFIGYEFIHDIEPVVPRPPKDELNTPVMYFLIADELLVFDRVAQTITIWSTPCWAARRRRRLTRRRWGKLSASSRCWNNRRNTLRWMCRARRRKSPSPPT